MSTISDFDSAEKLLSFLRSPDAPAYYLLPGLKRELPHSFDRQNRQIAFVTLAQEKDVLEYSPTDQVISLSLGLTLSEVAEILEPNRQFLPLDASPDTTLFELINNGEGGSWEHSFGGTRDLVLGTSIILTSGETVRTGGKVVKNVTGYDTTKLIVGGRMFFGIAVSAHLRLFAKPEWLYVFTYKSDSLLTLLDQAAVLMQAEIPLTSLDIESDNDDKCQMVIELAGHKTVVDELANALNKLANPNLILSSINRPFSEQTDAKLEARAKSPFELELSASVSEMRLVLALLNDNFTKRFSTAMRPGAGRLSIVFENRDEQNTFLALLEAACAKGEFRCIIARQDDQFERVIEQFSADRITSPRAIIGALKDKFDPQGILNPLVNWA